MIQTQTLLNIIDNSGGKTACCLKILKKGITPRYGKIGDLIIVSIKKLRSKNKFTSKVKKGDVLYGLIIKTQTSLKRQQGSSISFNQNSIVLLNKQIKPIATRVFGLIPNELKIHKFSKIITLSAGTI